MRFAIVVLFAAVVASGSAEQLKLTGASSSTPLKDATTGAQKALSYKNMASSIAGDCYASKTTNAELTVSISRATVTKVELMRQYDRPLATMIGIKVEVCDGDACQTCGTFKSQTWRGQYSPLECAADISGDSVRFTSANVMVICDVKVSGIAQPTERSYSSHVKMDWFEAHRTCSYMGGYISTPTTDAEFKDMNVENWDSFWTGWTDLDSEGTFVDEFGNAFPAAITWHWGQPDNYFGNEHCGGSYEGWTNFNDDDCSHKHNFYCTLGLAVSDVISMEEIKISTKDMDWYDARDYCVNEGGVLFTPKTYTEYMTINTQRWLQFWVGWNDVENEGKFFDTNNEVAMSGGFRWAPFQPDNSFWSEDCVGKSTLFKELNDMNCGTRNSFYCDLRK